MSCASWMGRTLLCRVASATKLPTTIYTMTKNKHFRKLVKKEVKKYALKYLLSKIKSKGREMKYNSNFECQGYLKPNSILPYMIKGQYFLLEQK